MGTLELIVFQTEYNNVLVNGIEYGKKLDIDPDTVLDITYAIADIQDITSVKSSFSKTITLPDTRNNYNVFRSIADLNFETNGTNVILYGSYAEPYFAVNSKVKCQVLIDKEIVFDGFLQLKDIVYNANNTISYNAVLYDATQHFVDNIADQYLSNLDFSPLDHSYTYANISNSWATDYSNGYHYPFIDYNNKWAYDNVSSTESNSFLKIDDFKPAMYVKTIWDYIFKGASYSYTSTFLNSEPFTNLIIPSSFKNLPVYATFSYDKLFKVSMSIQPTVFPICATRSSTRGQLLDGYCSYGSLPPYNIRWVGGPKWTKPQRDSPGGQIPTGQCQGVSVQLDDESNIYQDDNFDGNNLWDNANYIYTNKSSDVYTERFIFNFEGYTNFPFDLSSLPSAATPLTDGVLCFTFYRELNPLTGVTDSTWADGLGSRIPHSNGTGDDFYIYANGKTNFGDSNVTLLPFDSVFHQLLTDTFGSTVKSTYIKGSMVSDYLDNRPDTWNRFKPLLHNEKVRVVVRWQTSLFTYLLKHSGGSTGYDNQFTILGGTVSIADLCFGGDATQIELDSSITSFTPKTNFYNDVKSAVAPGGKVQMNLMVPNIKQTDFIDSIRKMFNLYFEPDKENKNNLIIEPRNTYVNSGVIRDWSNYVNLNEPINRQLLAETTNKYTIFSYKEDSDQYNKMYKDKYNEVYSTYTYTINDNEYLKGKTTTEILFSPSPLVKIKPFEYDLSKNFIFTQILSDSTNNNSEDFKFNYRILLKYSGGLFPLTYGAIYIYDSLNGVYHGLNGYPYAGTLDNPDYPTFSLDYGVPYETYFRGHNYTKNNLFETYWKDTLDELSGINACLLTVKMILPPSEIAAFSFKDIIYIGINGLNYSGGGQYYRINKISGYNPNDLDSNCTVELIKADKVSAYKISYTGGNVLAKGDYSIGTVTITDVTLAPFLDTYSPAISINSIVTANASARLLSSNSNNVSTNTVAFGSGNQIASPSIVMGNDNQIAASSDNIIVTGDSNIISSGVANSLVLGNNSKIEANLSNVIVIGDNVTANSSNMVVTSAPVVEYFNFIVAGNDIVLDEFSDGSLINYINGGRNVVSGIDKSTIINYINGGRDTV